MRQDDKFVKTQFEVFLSEDKSDDKLRYTVRFDPAFHEKVRITIARRHLRTVQDAIFKALEQWMESDTPTLEDSNLAATMAATPYGGLQVEGMKQLFARIDTLLQGQGAILQALGRITGDTPNQKPIESLALKVHDQTERGDSGLVATPAHIATGLIEHGSSSKPPEAIKKDRRGKQTKTPGIASKRRDRGTG